MFGIGETEFVLILVFAFLIFGPDKLPSAGRMLGRALRQFKNAQEGFTQVVQTEIVDPATEAMSDNPKKPNRNRAAEYDEDSDIEGGEGTSKTRKVETFAERKKRLAEERAAAEAAAAATTVEAEAAESADTAAEPVDSDADVVAATEAEVANEEALAKAPEAAAPADAPAPEPDKPTSLADLYARKPKRTTAPDAEASASESEPASVSAPESGPTSSASQDVSDAATAAPVASDDAKEV